MNKQGVNAYISNISPKFLTTRHLSIYQIIYGKVVIDNTREDIFTYASTDGQAFQIYKTRVVNRRGVNNVFATGNGCSNLVRVDFA
jgi:hypothetical protein